MTVSSHLTPDPERRLWLLLESMRRRVDGLDARSGGLAAFCVLELAVLLLIGPAGPAGTLATLALWAAAALALLAFYPLPAAPRWLPFSRIPQGAPAAADCLLCARDLAKHSPNELTLRLERYLGGGVTATPYYEDIVGQLLASARVATRKETVFRAACILAGVGQLGLLGRLLAG